MLSKNDFYINGRWVAPIEPNIQEVINPADETAFATISYGSAGDVDKAVAAARAAFPAYAALDREVRMGLIRKLLEIYRRRTDEVAEIVSREMGAPISFSARAQSPAGSGKLANMLEIDKSFDYEYDFGDQGEHILREPIGVCGLITPWNWPMNQVVHKAAPALVVGCTMILKPSEISPLSAMLFAEMIDEAGFPPGVFNLINGEGPVLGEAMSRHPDIDMMSFTGSMRGGTAVSRAAADTVKRVTLELGGKSPNLVFDDCDLNEAVARGVKSCMSNTGQTCVAPTRMLVQKSVYDQAVEIARTTAEEVKVGDPSKEGGHIGPLVNQTQFDKVQGLIEVAIAEGAELVAGGTGRPEGFNRGYYVRPTVFAGVNNQMTIAREEVFGPVLVMIPFSDEEEAVAIANDTSFGLAAYVQSGNQQRAERVARQLRAGIVEINGAPHAPGFPFGGYKHSGIGREGGRWGMDDYLETKSVSGWSKPASAAE